MIATTKQESRLFPDINEIKTLTPDYFEEDYRLIRFLDKYLPNRYEVYFEPFFNGNYPDAVILNPNVGITIYTVKKWQPSEVITETENRYDPKTNNVKKIHKFFRVQKGKRIRIPDPVTQVEHYRENLINLYCPFIGEEVERKRAVLAAFKVGLYFQYLTTKQARELIDTNEKRCIVFGYDALNVEGLDIIAPDHRMNSSIGMMPDWVDPIRFWLYPPVHPLDDQEKIKLDSKQERIAKPAPKKHMKVRGVIGSGKTLVIAHRAARLASKGKRVLVVTFNITLWHYIKHFVGQFPEKFDWKLIEFHHFHGFCRDYLSENEIPWTSSGDEDTSNLDQIIPQLVIDTRKAGLNQKKRSYDAILIDEGQDFQQSWYQALCKFLTSNDELLLVADEKQNLYRRQLEWINSPDNPKLIGEWLELEDCYRMPGKILVLVNKFAKTFLPEIGIEPKPTQLGFFDPNWVWLESTNFFDIQNKVLNCYSFLTNELKIAPKEIVIMVPSHKEGWELVEKLDKNHINVNHVFEDEEHPAHHHKKSFWITDPRLKITTIHSFKGWEMANVLLITPSDNEHEPGWADYLVYTAMSRTRQNLIVFNRISRYKKFGEEWPKAWTSPTRIF